MRLSFEVKDPMSKTVSPLKELHSEVPVGERYGVVVFFGLLPHNLFLTIYLLKFTEISDYDSS